MLFLSDILLITGRLGAERDSSSFVLFFLFTFNSLFFIAVCNSRVKQNGFNQNGPQTCLPENWNGFQMLALIPI